MPRPAVVFPVHSMSICGIAGDTSDTDESRLACAGWSRSVLSAGVSPNYVWVGEGAASCYLLDVMRHHDVPPHCRFGTVCIEETSICGSNTLAAGMGNSREYHVHL